MQTPQILIVEDEQVTRNTLKSIFEAEGYAVFEASNGEEMHQVLSDYPINLVIMDINLPGKNGLLLARELTIRARNLLSRSMHAGTTQEEKRSVEKYVFNGWELDINSRSLVSPDGDSYKLPRSEFRALLHFCENPGKIQTRADLLKKMTGRELKPHDRTVDVTIRRIRKHFESVSGTPEIIATIHGEGYRFCGDLED
ncbi:response regulator [Vibrio cholerae]|nr:response regulator [Vibrio cholerae]